MVGDHILSGDYVVVEKRPNALPGEVVVALLPDGTATLKRFYREPDGRVRLQPANASHAPLYVNRVEVQGVVRGVIRRWR
jgi:repressor LexA